VRVVALVESENHVCCRYRVTAFAEAFRAAGHTLEVRPLPRTAWGRLGIGRGLAADVVLVQRKLLPAWAVALLRRRVPRLVFDFDDAVWLRDSYSPRGLDDPRRYRRFRAVVRACDAVVAGNDYLARAAREHLHPDRVHVIPTCVEPARYDPARYDPARYDPVAGRPPDAPLRLVWVGSSSTLQGLERFAPTLTAIGRAVPGVRLKLICDRFITVPGLTVEPCLWREETEAAEIARADVGLAWVPDDRWSRGKCGLKVLQYHAAGLPVVANPVGVQAEMVRHGHTGLLARTPEEWVRAVTRLATNAELRQRLGRAGRRQVEERYSVAAGARRWLAVLDRLQRATARKTA
jgi:glycosyltransferase involved in cell wall biosynthesis